jgi:hypothetical protein
MFNYLKVCKDGFYWDKLLNQCLVKENCDYGYFKNGDLCVESKHNN